MRTKILSIFLFMLLGIPLFAQYGDPNNHYAENKFITASALIGDHHLGGGVFAGYYFTDRLYARAGGIYRRFNYKSYNENILEGNLDANYVIIIPDYYSYYFSNFSVIGQLGFSAEMVKVTSKTQLIDPYPKYIYTYLGAEIEYTMSRHLSLVGSFRQFYALNGSKDKLGVNRYDAGLSLKYYIFDF